MRRLFYLLFVAVFIYSCGSEPHYVIEGDIENSDSVTFVLQKREAGTIVNIDSAISRKGSFRMKGAVSYPDMVQLIALNTMQRLTFYVENSKITINGQLDSLANATVTGSKTQDEYQSFIESNRPLSEKYADLYAEYQKARQGNNTEEMARIEKEAEDIQAEMTQIQKDFVKDNPSSFVSPAILRSLSYEMDAIEIEEAINAMDADIAQSPVARELMERVQVMKAVSIGQKAPDFTLDDVDGNPVALSSKIGTKLLLIDFWAAWCTPCRQENPNLVKVYKDFNKKGFDVFSVSLDRDKDDWVQAIADDRLTWTHVSDLQYWNSSAAQLYAVNAIPANFLLDENGIIIARNLRGTELYNKVNTILSD
jgi:peroxiredoxin